MNKQKIYIITDKDGKERRSYHSPEEIEERNKRLPKHVEFRGKPVAREYKSTDSIKKDIIILISAISIAAASIMISSKNKQAQIEEIHKELSKK